MRSNPVNYVDNNGLERTEQAPIGGGIRLRNSIKTKAGKITSIRVILTKNL
jgi:hypothetical protein